ncbi:hypothetical protein EJD97_008491, partial [Solanum chilense]
NKDSICWKSVKTRLGRRTSRRIVVVTTGRHGLSHPIHAISFASLFITLDGRNDRSSQAQRSIGGLRSITLELLEFEYWDYFSDLYDEPEGRTLMATMVHHALRNATLGQNSPSSFSNCTTMTPTDLHEYDGPSQAP